MVPKLEYDFLVRRLNPATVAVLALALLVPAALAQVNGVPASVTSNGFGGSSGPRGIAPSVTSRGFSAQGHYALPPTVTSPRFSTNNRGFVAHPVPRPSRHPRRDSFHHQRGGAVYALPYYYAYPYAYDDNEPSPPDDSADDEYLGGPTIFDRRGPGTSPLTQDSYADQGPAHLAAAPQAEDQPVSNQADTVLVFKDGHQLEVANYAIVGTTLFDLSEGHRHKIPLSELNLTATAKENDDRGVDFQLPASSEAN